MGFGDKLKNLTKQAQDAVAEHKDQIHDAVDAVSVAADRRTRGKYTDKIQKMGQKAGDAVDKLGAIDEQPGGPDAPAPATGAPAGTAGTPPGTFGTPAGAAGTPAGTAGTGPSAGAPGPERPAGA